MVNKGLCVSCENDPGCVFQGRFPILQCEEFFTPNGGSTKVKQLKQKDSKCCREEVTEE
ncbi:MAG: hypothetical protein WC628_04995 [Candidatus Omnitrophota bacterium]